MAVVVVVVVVVAADDNPVARRARRRHRLRSHQARDTARRRCISTIGFITGCTRNHHEAAHGRAAPRSSIANITGPIMGRTAYRR
ncbi:hypothetical protein ACVBGC_19195 [Burkholderia stagnalis]